MSVGRELQTARVRTGLSLEDLSQLTKLRVSVLNALEGGNIDELPPLVFVRGYLAAYAREVGLDPQDLAERGIDELVEESSRRQVRLSAPAGKRRSAGLGAPIDRKRSAVTASALTLLALLVGYLLWTPTNLPSEDVAVASLGVASGGTGIYGDPERGATAGAQAPFRLEITTSRSVFVSATADGVSLLARQLEAGERQVIESVGRVVLRVSDPRRVSWWLDGRAGISLGHADEPVTIQVSRDTLEDFLVR